MDFREREPHIPHERGHQGTDHQNHPADPGNPKARYHEYLDDQQNHTHQEEHHFPAFDEAGHVIRREEQQGPDAGHHAGEPDAG